MNKKIICVYCCLPRTASVQRGKGMTVIEILYKFCYSISFNKMFASNKRVERHFQKSAEFDH